MSLHRSSGVMGHVRTLLLDESQLLTSYQKLELESQCLRIS
jgi:hypothetical protein